MELQFIILSAIIHIAMSQRQSPCPDIFSYESETNENDRWYGVVSLRTSEELSGVWLRVFLDRPAELLGNWFGEAFSTDNKEYVIRNSKYKLEAGPPVSVRFFVKFDLNAPPPKVVKIALNGKTICMASEQENVKPTTPTLHISQLRPSSSSNSQSVRPLETPDSNSNRQSTTRRPSNSNGIPTSRPSGGNLNFNGGSESDSEFFQGDFAPIQRPAQDKPTSISDPTSSSSSSCGVVAAKATPLITHGQETSPGQWPWHAALYLSRGIQLRYICGATLITERHIVTAAHCVTKPQTDIAVNPSNILVYFGKYDLITFGPEVQDRSVSTIFVHPEYNNTVFFNDIAVLKLSKPVKVTNFIRPCCLWEGDSNLENIQSEVGTVIGWGFDESGQLSNKLLQANMPIVSTVSCIYSNRDFFSRFTFEKNFCAGFRNGTSVCNGDSGGGMVFPRKGRPGQNTVWQIRGLVSVGVALQGQGTCDTSQYIVFTDVAKYTHWIRQVVSN